MLLLLLALAQQVSTETPVEIDPSVKAEYVRLSEEIDRLAERQLWQGVERKYQQMEALGVPLTYDDYWNGALAARHLGEVQLTYDRLSQAARIEGTREVIDWLWSIDTSYGRVELKTEPEAPATLSIASMPLVPDQRAAVEAAQRHVQESGVYVGMLPAGEYTFADQQFTVTPGPKAVTIVVAPVETSARP